MRTKVIDEIKLATYDPSWPEKYRTELGRVIAALPAGVVRRAEHIGSTAVPGMIAKPIVDVLIRVSDLEEARITFPRLLEKLGYAYWAENPKKDRLFFVKGLPPNGPRTFHIHVTTLDGEMWERVLFRDYLRAHADEARRYEQLKRELAERFPEDREAYSEAKTFYHEEVVAKAKSDPQLNGGMTGAEVVDLYSELERRGIRVWIDGGWCVDALLGKQTRPHGDVDIAIELRHVDGARGWLESRGYREVKRDNEWNFEMADPSGRKVDFHAFVQNDAGHVVDGIQYPDGSLTGVGKINGHSVRCISPKFMMKFHSGYLPRETDVQDVQALHKKFQLPLRPEYEPERTHQTFEPVKRVASYFARYSPPWYVAGGWAVDLFLGRQTRPHPDIEVAVLRRDQRLLRNVFEGWTWSKIVPGPQGSVRTVWGEQEWLELPIHELHASEPNGELLEVLLQESDAEAWQFRRDPTISMPLSKLGLHSEMGIPILRPEVVLLYKAKSPKPKDEADFIALLPALGDAQAAWLGGALDRCHPRHPWRARLKRRE